MRHRNFWRALGLSLIGALSLLAFSAVSAQAGLFKINEKELLATITGSQVGTGLLLVAGRNLTIKCTGGNIEEGSEIISGHEALAKVQFTGCSTFEHKSPEGSLPCTVANPLAITKAFPRLHEGERYVLFEPDIKADASHEELLKALFTTVKLSGESCPLPKENPVTGSTLALVDDNNTATPDLLFKHSLSGLLGDALKFGGFASTIQGTAFILATGEHLDGNIGIL